MALCSVTARNMALDAAYGDSKASGWPATVYLALFNGDPNSGGSELAATGGYARVAVTNNGPASSGNFNTASGGSKTNANTISFAASTAAFASSATHFCFLDSASGGNKLDGGALSTTVTVSQSNTTVRFTANQITISAA